MEAGETSGPEMYARLRAMALDAVDLGMEAPPEHPEVAGVVIDVPMGEDWVTIVAMGEGTTSMYTSTGGGTIGGGQHEAVRAASLVLLQMLNANVKVFPESDTTGHPPADRVRFFVLTPSGRRVADVYGDVFWGRKQDPSTPLAMAAQAVIGAIGQASPPNA